MIAFIVIAALIILIALWFIATKNSFVRAENQVEEGFATIDVYLKKRYDLIPNLVETVKGYARHESETLEQVIAARNTAMRTAPADLSAKIDSENALTGTLRQLFAVAEAYPDLKANANFIDLQNQLKTIEEDIANARKYYNATVRTFNNKTEVFPASIVAGMSGYTAKPYFEAADTERENVKVQF
ncbi:LemA family protein [Pseudoramibacter faecis]|uniref:LemA family protein n=1 Tax=Pseudoramibacter faecis TaxID=3108534 RepID=UPI002E7851D8|nr:LemA family protein [Pseudoramibacter sp. HA2172]